VVATAPRRLWISLDGPAAINDQQRGRGVHRQVLAGIERLHDARQSHGRELPKIGVTLIVTPLNQRHVAPFFTELLGSYPIDHVSIEFQNYATAAEHRAYAEALRRAFGVDAAPVAAGWCSTPRSLPGWTARTWPTRFLP